MRERNISQKIRELLKKRDSARVSKDFNLADKIRVQLENLGYLMEDGVGGTRVIKKEEVELKNKGIKELKNGLVAIFGSGEMSPTGRKIHEYLIKDKKPPVKIALLETPAGFEENPCYWYEKLKEMMTTGLAPYQPEFFFVEAFRKDGEKSTNDKGTINSLLGADYIHTGAGSPTYAAKHLKNSLAFKYLCEENQKGTALSFASAAAIAIGSFVLPVYEIYKAGLDLYWENGLNFFEPYGLNISFIPHWNNSEGGRYIDTSCCYMGKERMKDLLKLLPDRTIVIGVDEQTAAIFDLEKKEILVMGNGGIIVINGKKQEHISSESKISFNEIASLRSQ